MYRFFCSTVFHRSDAYQFEAIYDIFSKGDVYSKIEGPSGIEAQGKYYFSYPESLSENEIGRIIFTLKKLYDSIPNNVVVRSEYIGEMAGVFSYPIVINTPLEYYESLPNKYVFTDLRISKILTDSQSNIQRLYKEITKTKDNERRLHLNKIMRTLLILHMIFIEDNLASSDPDKKEFLSATKEVIDAIKL
jgi:hypothetical protein